MSIVAAVDRLERAAMAYERLGKLTRDDEKTRQIRKDTIAELAAARAGILAFYAEIDTAGLAAATDAMGDGVEFSLEPGEGIDGYNAEPVIRAYLSAAFLSLR